MSVGTLAARERQSSPLPAHALRWLSGAAVSLGEGADVDGALADLVDGVRQLLSAERASLLLLDATDRLVPAVSIARHEDQRLHHTFRSMRPISLAEVPHEESFRTLMAGGLVVIPDASASPLIPPLWRERFSLSRLVLAPLRVENLPVGLLVVDLDRPGEFTSTERALLEGAAALLALTLRDLLPSAPLTEQLCVALRAVGGSRTAADAASRVLDALVQLTGADGGALLRLATSELELVATRGPRWPAASTYPLTDVPAELQSACEKAWTGNVVAPVGWRTDDRDFIVLPLPRGDRVPAVAVLEAPAALRSTRKRLEVAARALGTALAEREHAELRHRDGEAARLVSSWSTDAPSPARALADLADATPRLAGVRLLDAAVANQRLAKDTELRRATGDLRDTITRWRRSGRPVAPGRVAGRWVVPLVASGRTVGAMLFDREPVGSDGVERIVALATAYAALIARTADAAALGRAEPALAHAMAGTELTARCYAEASQLLAAVRMDLNRAMTRDPKEPLHHGLLLLAEARRIIRDAAEALSPTGNAARPLGAALRDLFDQVEANGGPPVVLRRSGRLPVVPVANQVGFLRAAYEALCMLRTARAGAVVARLEGAPWSVRLTLTVNEVATPALDGSLAAPAATLRRMRGWLTPIGGEARYESVNGKPVLTLGMPGEHGSGTSVEPGEHVASQRR